MRFSSSLLAGLFFACGLGTAACAREWTVDGAVVEADYAGAMGDVVFLKTAEGHRLKHPLSSLSAEDRAFLAERSSKGSTSVVATAPAAASPARTATRGFGVVAGALQGKLVGAGPGGFSDVALRNPACDYYVIYYSAGWCGPCHRFTPTLVDFYNTVHPAEGSFEVIFVSSDRSERDMLAYMQEFKMPWPAVRFADLRTTPELTRYAGDGIPCVVVVDAQGRVVADSYVNGRYVGPVEPVKELARRLKAAKG